MAHYTYPSDEVKEGHTSIVDFFDPLNMKHIEAWKHLAKTGFWQEGFIPEDVVFTNNWMIGITFKVCNAWVEHFPDAVDIMSEMVDLVTDHIEGMYDFDSFSKQPMEIFLSKVKDE